MNFSLDLIFTMFKGLKVTLEVFIFTLILSLPLGFIVSLFRTSTINFLKKFSSFYVWIMRGTPLLLQLVIIFFGLPMIGINLDRLTSVIIAFSLNYGAYFSEIFRTGIKNIDKGQFEASEVLGLSKVHTLKRIIIPQMIKNVMPAITSEVITLIKDTALVYVVGLSELLRVGKIASNNQASLMPLLLTGVIYLIIIGILTKVFSKVEKYFAYYS